tara:strand:+ start:1862 stop:3136 length:1275 start_codon:yes stop_codon:yes gene_type:complete
MARKSNIFSYGSAEGAQDTSFADIIELLNAFSKRDEYHNTEVGKEILQLNASVDSAQNLGTIDNLLNIINSNTSNYSTNNANKYASQTVYNKASQKEAEIKYYRKKVDNMQDKYFGVDEKPGFENLSTDDILNWTYDSVSDEIMSIKDFEAVFFTDYEKQSPVNFSYNPNKIKTDDLRRRVDAYKNNIYTALEALRGDGLISEYELPFVVTGDKEALASSKEHYSKAYKGKIKNSNKAVSAIKKNIANLKDWIVKESIRGKGDGNIFTNPDLVTSEQAYIKSGINLHQQFGAKYDADISLQESEPKEDYVERMVRETIPQNPLELVRQWSQEIQGYENNNAISEREFYKWMGYKMQTDNTPTNIKEEWNKEFNNKDKPWSTRAYPKSKDEVPIDLTTDRISRHYYSNETNEYYDKDTIDALYNY